MSYQQSSYPGGPDYSQPPQQSSYPGGPASSYGPTSSYPGGPSSSYPGQGGQDYQGYQPPSDNRGYQPPNQGYQPPQGGQAQVQYDANGQPIQDGERGLGTMAMGAAAGWGANKMSGGHHGAASAIGGAILAQVGSKVFKHFQEGKNGRH
ncbi:hypothetical protein OC846_003561 [Tilletia horrida]|uniref:Glycine zipper 2TM domain-containing protein n=1 Tax=Tilletia horrida TaxID=155126 RepID=A0AAN6GS84_9BASI|nr:hypothetical protein OC845_003833 [Tilletia horrida]KAK0550704.1 hypothetical protein OC846_003561 [Tilletia horrida]KAK0565971.1 hypothetical protein OC861_003485 [Tilletia horrida]